MIAAESEADPARVAEEIGDALFTLASYARHRGANGEMLLHAALDRFQERFARMEAELALQGLAIETLDERPRLCGDTASLMQSLKEAGYEAGEMQEYKQKTEELICSPL